ncbi:MAG: 7-carboxy-7-deazaguanine synthase [bacterium]|nr:7-carboxy-7-deazaguanine synthase [bacterium]
MSYTVKEIFYSLQGEGFHTGRPAVFCRFAGCNLSCDFCDTDFEGTDGSDGGVYETAEHLAAKVATLWPDGAAPRVKPFVVCTGGEPLLQLDAPLLDALHDRGCLIAVETNGTIEAPPGIDWLTVSPKEDATFLQKSGDELKLLYPQRNASPQQFEDLDFQHFCLQPVDTPDLLASRKNREATVAYCLQQPLWRLSLQGHKIVGIR